MNNKNSVYRIKIDNIGSFVYRKYNINNIIKNNNREEKVKKIIKNINKKYEVKKDENSYKDYVFLDIYNKEKKYIITVSENNEIHIYNIEYNIMFEIDSMNNIIIENVGKNSNNKIIQVFRKLTEKKKEYFNRIEREPEVYKEINDINEKIKEMFDYFYFDLFER